MNVNCEIRVVDAHKGKGLFALKDLANGTLIFEEDPLVCAQYSWNKAYKYLACDHCLRPLETTAENVKRLTGGLHENIPHQECCVTDKTQHVSCPDCGTLYCSSECMNLALNQYHRTLCTQNNENHPLCLLEEAWKLTHYPPETCTIMLIPKILATIHQSPNPNETLNLFLQFCHKTVNETEELVHTLLGEKFTNQIEEFRQLLCNAIPTAGVEKLISPDGFKALLALIGTNGQGVGTSPLACWANKVLELPLNEQEKVDLDKYIDTLYDDVDKVSGQFLNSEGTALFNLQSACNHNCDNNAKVHYLNNNSRLSLMACKDIKAGEEICTSYLDECIQERGRYTRNKILTEYYLFKCNCTKCILQQDDTSCTTTSEDENMEEEDEDDNMA